MLRIIEKNWQERLEISSHLNSIAFNYPLQSPPGWTEPNSRLQQEVNMRSNIFNEDFRDFLTALNDQQVCYILVGGFSVILHGYSRTTGGMDIWVEITQQIPLVN